MHITAGDMLTWCVRTRGHLRASPLDRPESILIFALTYLHHGLLCQLLVHLWPVGDVLCPVGVVQCAQGLFQVHLCRRDGGNDGGAGPPSQRVLQHPCQLALAVWDMRRPLHQCSYYTAEGEETLVDVPCLPCPLVNCARATNVLTAGQINLHTWTHATHSPQHFNTQERNFNDGHWGHSKHTYVRTYTYMYLYVHAYIVAFAGL